MKWIIRFQFPHSQKRNQATQRKHMKKLLTLTSIVSIGAIVILIPACQTTGSSQSVIAQEEALLSQSGFKVITVTTPDQRQAVSGLA